MKIDLTRLDEMWMKELFRKHYGMDIPIKDVHFLDADSHVKVWADGIGWIMMCDDETMSTEKMDMPGDIAWDILARMRVCSNCKFWDMLDMSCAKTGDSVHESNGAFWQRNANQAFLYIDDDVVDVDIKDGHGGFETVDGWLDADEIENRVTVNFDGNFSCRHHEFKED